MKSNKGYSLINLLVALCISATLVSTATAGLSELTERNKTNSTSKQLFRIINFARLEAVNRGSSIVICPSTDSENCTHDWSSELLVFNDANRDNVFQSDRDEILLRSELVPKGMNINWRSFGSRPYLSFDALGSTGYQNGRIYICNLDENHKAQIIVYRTGRARYALKSELRDRCI